MGEEAISKAETEPAGEGKAVSWAQFLATCSPDTTREIEGLCYQRTGQYTPHWVTRTPDVQLHCESCGGSRFFQCDDGTVHVQIDSWKFDFLYYSCRNCRKQFKTYAVAIKQKSERSTSAFAVKLGETPPFGPSTPPRVITLIGPDRELFLKGRRAEIRGLGIGAFSYYRRVVENQKGRIIEQIAKVAQKIGAKPDILAEFKAAASETQFSKAIDQIKHGIPEALLIDGHNPLTLLHSALSDGMHDRTDEECLEVAQHVRIVLTELAERLSVALKQDAELADAVTKLLARKSGKPPTS
jgi:hypothetical protein